MPGPSRKKPQQRKRKQKPTKRPQKSISDFERKSKEAATAQSKLNKAKERQRQLSQSPRIQLDTTKLQANKSIEVINLITDSSQGSPIKIFFSNHPTAFMTIPATKITKTPERVNKKIDEIIHRITHSPKKQNQENEPQLISITPADNTSPNTELISIKPAHQSTPVEPQLLITATTTQVNPKDDIENNNQLVTNKPPINIDSGIPTRDNQVAQQPTKDTNKINELNNHTKHHDTPEERKNIDEPTEVVHMEEDNCDTATISSISSWKILPLSTSSLTKQPKNHREGSVVEKSTESNQAHQVLIKTLLNYIHIYLYPVISTRRTNFL